MPDKGSGSRSKFEFCNGSTWHFEMTEIKTLGVSF